MGSGVWRRHAGSMTFLLLAAAGLAVLLMASGVRLIHEDEQAVVRRPGARPRVADPGLLWHLPVVGSVTRFPSTPWHSLTVVRASTADGVTVHLEAEATLRFTDAALIGPDSRAVAQESLEEALRRYVTANRLDVLPGAGDLLEPSVGLPPGVALVRIIVTGCDAEVTPELRRLVRRTRP